MHYANVGMLSDEVFRPPLDDEIMTGQTEGDRRGERVMPYHPALLPELYDEVAHFPTQPTISPAETLRVTLDWSHSLHP